jgi:hypothetical protein
MSFGQKIYLSTEGTDSNPGSYDKPLAALDKISVYLNYLIA